MPNINITVAGKIATNTTPGVVIVCGNSDYTATFAFDSEWAGETKRTARFLYYRDGLARYQEVTFTGTTVAVPALYGVSYVLVGVYAGDLHTTTPAKVLCDRSILCGDQENVVAPTAKEQLLAMIGDLAGLETKDKSSLVAAINEAAKTGSNSSENSSTKTETLNPTWISGKYIMHTSGTEMESSIYSVTEYVDVSQYSTVNVLTKVAGTAGVCLFDASKTYISGLQPPQELTAIDVSGSSYLRVSCWTASFPNPVIEAVVTANETLELDTTLTQAGKAADAKAVGDALEELSAGMSSEMETDLYDSTRNTNRQYYDTTGALVTDVYGWYTTEDMDVSEAASLTYGGLSATATAATPRSVFKDADGGIVRVFLPATGENVLAVPEGAVSVSFTLHMNDVETFYARFVKSVSLVTDIVGGWYGKLGARMNNLLNKATQKKICCIVDDDTADTDSVTLFKNACDANGIKGTLASLTYNWTKDTALKDTLLSMEREGFQTVIHAYSQVDAWLDPETNTAVCESNLVQGMQEMHAAGFQNYKYWVTPYCKDTAKIQSMGRKWDMKCILAGGNAYEPADDTYGRFALRRAAFGPSDADSSITLAQLQTIAQDAANNNGWLIVMTHFEAWKTAGGDYTRFAELIDYLKGLGFEFMTVAEAWSYREAIYDVYDMF